MTKVVFWADAERWEKVFNVDLEPLRRALNTSAHKSHIVKCVTSRKIEVDKPNILRFVIEVYEVEPDAEVNPN